MPPKQMILPLPRSIKLTKGKFHIIRSTPIILSPSCTEQDYNTAKLLRTEFETRASIDLSIEKHATEFSLKNPICLVLARDITKTTFATKSLTAKLKKDIGTEGYLIETTSSRLLVVANSSKGLFYAVQTLRQALVMNVPKAHLECGVITDWPVFENRGVMLDISRGKVPTMTQLKSFISDLASAKINVLQLYTEHTFSFRRHPEIGRGCGTLTSEEIMILDAHARANHIELQANLQSFGHMTKILELPEYNKYSESKGNWCINPGVKSTYDFLGELYDELLPSFSSDVFNADCDETNIGGGKSKALCEKLGAGVVYLNHIKKLNALAKKRGKKLQIWGDIVLNHPELIKDVPKDVTMINWGYGANVKPERSMAFKKAGLNLWVAPGTGSWNSLFPRIHISNTNITLMASAGIKAGATGLLNTDWGDGGHPNMMGCSFYSYAFGAEISWSGPSKHEDFAARFSWLIARDKAGTLGKIFETLKETNAVFAHQPGNNSIPYMLYWAPFPYDKAFDLVKAPELTKCEKIAIKVRGMISAARQNFPTQKLLLDELDYAARQTIFACVKTRLAKKVRKCVPLEDGESGAGYGGKGITNDLMFEVVNLHREWELLRDEFERIWLMRAKKSEIEIRLQLYREREQELARLAVPTTR